MDSITLRNEMKIPPIIFGPDEMGYTPHRKQIKSKIKRGINKIKKRTIDEYVYIDQVANAFKLGYTALDFSAAYGDGRLIAKAIEKAGVDREKLFLTTRISNKAQYKGTHAIEEEIKNQLHGFETDYIDMLMFHWPVTGHFEETWQTMIKLREQGLCKMLGVANCHEHHLEKLYEVSGEYPLVDQVEVHPLLTQIPLREYCKEHKIQIEAYSPTARQDDRIMNPPMLNDLANKYNKTKTQLILKWHIQNGMIPVTRSLTAQHQKSNIDIFDFEISNEDMVKINSLNINSRVRYDPDNCDFSAL